MKNLLNLISLLLMKSFVYYFFLDENSYSILKKGV